MHPGDASKGVEQDDLLAVMRAPRDDHAAMITAHRSGERRDLGHQRCDRHVELEAAGDVDEARVGTEGDDARGVVHRLHAADHAREGAAVERLQEPAPAERAIAHATAHHDRGNPRGLELDQEVRPDFGLREEEALDAQLAEEPAHPTGGVDREEARDVGLRELTGELEAGRRQCGHQAEPLWIAVAQAPEQRSDGVQLTDRGRMDPEDRIRAHRVEQVLVEPPEALAEGLSGRAPTRKDGQNARTRRGQPRRDAVRLQKKPLRHPIPPMASSADSWTRLSMDSVRARACSRSSRSTGTGSLTTSTTRANGY